MRAKALHYIGALELHHRGPQVRRLQNMSVAGSVFHIWVKGLHEGEKLNCVNYVGIQDAVKPTLYLGP